MQKSSLMKLPSATKEDNDEFCNNKSSGRREKKRKKIISAQFRWSSERASEQAKVTRSPNTTSRKNLGRKNPFSFRPHTPSQGP
jgi:hypothetical protein